MGTPKKPRDTPWIVLLTSQSGAHCCLRCGEVYEIHLPARMELVCAMAKSFEKLHRGCRPHPAGDICHFCRQRGHAAHDCNKTRPVTPQEWIVGPDTGSSSKTIWAVMMAAGAGHHGFFDSWPPSDPDDFGRCYRLLRAFPDWRPRMPEVAVRFAAWKPLVEAWDELTALYELEQPAGSAPKLYARMRALLEREAVRRAGG